MSALLDFLIKNKNDRGIMADLRCAIIETKRFRAYPYLGYFGGIGEKHEARVKQTIAGMYSTHPETTVSGNFGDLCRKLCTHDENMQKGAMAKRFQTLLAANREEIFERIVKIIFMAKSKDIPVDYEQLEKDLIYWGDSVKNRWAMSFWTTDLNEGKK